MRIFQKCDDVMKIVLRMRISRASCVPVALRQDCHLIVSCLSHCRCRPRVSGIGQKGNVYSRKAYEEQQGFTRTRTAPHFESDVFVWFVNLFDTNPNFFQGIEPHDLQADDPGAIQEALQVIKREHKQHPECFTFNRKAVSAVESFLLEGTYPRHCILGYTNVDIDPKGGVYSGCWAMKPMGNIREQSLEAILSNPAYTSRARHMLDRHCPQCTCGWMVNTMYDHFFR